MTRQELFDWVKEEYGTQPGYYRAYHMNKNQWISIFLDGSVPDEAVKNLIAESRAKTGKKSKKVQRKEK